MTSWTSGSCAVLSMTVTPGASEAAMIRFSVPVCEGVSRYRCAPRSPSALTWIWLSPSTTVAPSRAKPAVVEVQVAAAEIAAADVLEHRLAEPVQQRGHEQHRAAELPGDLGGQHRAGQLGGVDHQRPLRLVELDDRADRLGELDGPAHVLDHRDVPQYRAALLGEQRRGDHLQCRVLGALDEHRALQRVAASTR